jgi:hypothetical protein
MGDNILHQVLYFFLLSMNPRKSAGYEKMDFALTGVTS